MEKKKKMLNFKQDSQPFQYQILQYEKVALMAWSEVMTLYRV